MDLIGVLYRKLKIVFYLKEAHLENGTHEKFVSHYIVFIYRKVHMQT